MKTLEAAVHWHRPVVSGTRDPQAIHSNASLPIRCPSKFQELEVLPSLACVLTGSFNEVIDDLAV